MKKRKYQSSKMNEMIEIHPSASQEALDNLIILAWTNSADRPQSQKA